MYELNVQKITKTGKASKGAAVTLDPEALGGKVRSRLLHQAIVMYAANKRQGTHKTKTRGEVNYTNKKPYRQKGTGRARAGTRRSPIWRGGGTTFGPRPRDYSYAIPKKAKRRAVQSALLSKFRDNETTMVAEFPQTGKTKDAVQLLKALGIQGKVLLVTAEHNEKLALATRNLRDVGVLKASDLNAYDLLYHKQLVMTQGALDKALEVFGETAKAEG
ncbi:MAG: 50S ribosomal protein L4 [Planctomycetota bacterium]|jgi:large subunit ribosomal protein L4